LVLLIGETIGWQELIVIGILALIFFGPRKIPDLARTVGKYMAEFRKITGEFRKTWEEEVNYIKEEIKDTDSDIRMLAHLENPMPLENSIGGNKGVEEALETESNTVSSNGSQNGNKIEPPTVKQIEPGDIPQIPETIAEPVAVVESKKDWL
jgi:sec-independent protein translocase protein TatB